MRQLVLIFLCLVLGTGISSAALDDLVLTKAPVTPELISYTNTNWAPAEDEGFTFTFMVDFADPPHGATFSYRNPDLTSVWTTLDWTPTKSTAGIYPTEFLVPSTGVKGPFEWMFTAYPDSGLGFELASGDFATGTWSLYEIQYVDPCAPDQSSPLDGMAVNIECQVVVVDSSSTAKADSTEVSATFAVCEPNFGIYPTEFCGTSIIDLGDVDVEEGDVIRLGGHVLELDGLTAVTLSSSDAVYLISFGNDGPEPLRLSTAVLADDVQDSDCVRGEAYESLWVRPLDSVVMDTSDFPTNGTYLISSSGQMADALRVRHSGPLAFVPNIGQIVDLTGYMTYRNSEFQLVVTSDDDITLGTQPPELISYTNTNWAPAEDEGFTFTFMVDFADPPFGATFSYRNPDLTSVWTTLDWTPTKSTAGIYPTEFLVPSTGVKGPFEWMFTAYPDSGLGFELASGDLATGTWSLDEIQYVDPCAPDQSSPLDGMAVNIECQVVVADSSMVVVWDPLIGTTKGVYPTEFVGASYYPEDEDLPELFPGDEVRYAAQVVEVDGLTTVNPISGEAIYLLSFGNTLPEPLRLSTAVLADDVQDSDCVRGEAYESLWVRPLDSVVMDTSDFPTNGTYLISSSGQMADALRVRHSGPLAFVPNIGQIVDLTGYMTYRNSEFQLVVTSDDDIVPNGWSEVPEEIPAIIAGFVSIAPNPFNPQTKICFNVDKESLVQLNIYDLQGALVNQMVDARMPGGKEYVRNWDGTDQRGRVLASGTYFARLKIGSEIVQVQKLTLLK